MTSTIAYSFSVSRYCKTRPDEIIDNLDSDSDSVDDEKLDRAAKDYYRELNCPGTDEYSIFGQLFFVPLADALKFLLHLGEALDDSVEGTSSELSDYEFEVCAHIFLLFLSVLVKGRRGLTQFWMRLLLVNADRRSVFVFHLRIFFYDSYLWSRRPAGPICSQLSVRGCSW